MDRLPYPVYPALPPPPKRRSRSWIGVLVLSLGALALAGFLFFQAATAPTGKSAVVRIPEGAGALQVGKILEREGLIRSARAFALLARLTGAERKLHSGVFRLEGEGTEAVLRQLLSAQTIAVRITFPEGWRAVDYAGSRPAGSTARAF